MTPKHVILGSGPKSPLSFLDTFLVYFHDKSVFLRSPFLDPFGSVGRWVSGGWWSGSNEDSGGTPLGVLWGVVQKRSKPVPELNQGGVLGPLLALFGSFWVKS